MFRIVMGVFFAIAYATSAYAGKYEDGVACRVSGDENCAFEVFSEAAEEGNGRAQQALAFMYEQGKGVEQDLRVAFELYLMAAQSGYRNAQIHVSFYYAVGWGVARSNVDAVRWIKAAADAGYTPAKSMLSEIDGGALQTKYPNSAFTWYMLGAIGGQRTSRLVIAEMYWSGERGVSQNYEKAVYWYKEAAKMGSIDAFLRLATAYSKGLGVEQDSTTSLVWFNLAAPHDLSEFVKPERDAVVAQMTREQVADAKRLSMEWSAKHQPMTEAQVLVAQEAVW